MEEKRSVQEWGGVQKEGFEVCERIGDNSGKAKINQLLPEKG